MSDKVRLTYKLEESYDGKWDVVIYSREKFASAEIALETIKSMYKLEDPNDIDASIEVRGNTALDLLFGIGEK